VIIIDNHIDKKEEVLANLINVKNNKREMMYILNNLEEKK
jgi:hypothetical protein